jgi:hypothetical protein
MMRSLLILALAACGPAIPPVPSKGGPAWIELTSEHFTLWTDTSAAHGRKLVREMEHLRQVVFGVAFSDVPNAGRSFVIALRNEREAGAFVPEGFAAFAFPPGGSPLRQPMIVLSADADEGDTGHILTHELTHVISHVVIHEQPHWFAEGIANFFQTVRLDPDRAVVDVGEPLEMMVKAIRARHLTPMSQVFGCTDLSCMDAGFYMTTWALFTYLANVRPADLARYEDRLAQTSGPAAQAALWTEVFPDLTTSKLDQELPYWLAQGKHTTWHFTVKLQEWPVVERVLGDGDVLASRALLRLLLGGNRKPNELAAALAVEPTNVIARLIEALVDGAVDPGHARAVVTAHPEDWRAWALLALALKHGDEAGAAQVKACTLAAANPAIVPPSGLCSRR